MMCRLLALVLSLLIFSNPAFAVYEKGDGFPWNLTLQGYHDRELAEALGAGFFMNVGPTGIRAQITHEHPEYFTVKFVFSNSPAHKKIKPGDIIVGANGKIMQQAHKFGRRTVTGWDGPMTAMAILIEEAQANEGKLDLIVWPGGKERDKTTVSIQLEPRPRFAETYPFNCERSDQLMKDLCDFLANEYQRAGRFESRVHTHSTALLALMASGDDRYAGIIRQAMSDYPNKTYNSLNGGGFPAWSYGYDGIVMAEYYNLTKDKSMLPAMKSLAQCMIEAQDWRSGGYQHKPGPFIYRRIADGGPKGYGSMAAPGGLAMLAQSLMKASGAEYPKVARDRTHQAYLFSASSSGEIGYGFNGWDHAVIKLKGDSVGKAVAKQGLGYMVPEGMKDIKEYEIVWPTKADPRYKPTDWVKNEADTNFVVMSDKDTRTIIRDMSMPEPKGPYQTSAKGANHLVRTGTGALAHLIGTDDTPSWKHMGNHLALACALSPDRIFDGHASTLMHTLWASLAASRADERAFRAYMDQIKWWFVMAETHDGGFVPMPGRDYASTDHVYATRNLPTATAACILALKEQKLLITGADAPKIERTPQSQNNDRGPGTRQRPQLSVLGGNFEAQLLDREAKMLAAGTPYATVLRSLEQHLSREDERAKEAAGFIKAINDWLAEQNKLYLEMVQTAPATALAQSRDHVRRLTGLDDNDAKELVSTMRALGTDRDIRMLSRYIEQFDEILELEQEHGQVAALDDRRARLAQVVQRFASNSSLSEAVVNEARALLADLGHDLGDNADTDSSVNDFGEGRVK